MFTASNIAEAWEEYRRQSSDSVRKSLEQWIDENPDMFHVVVATAAQTGLDFSMTMGAGFVDALNLGKGAAEGGWGYAQDGLRFLTLVAPLAKGGRMLLSRVVPDANLPNCTWVAATKALRATGTRHFAVVEDLMRAAGLRNIGETGGAFVDEVLPWLRQLGARARQLANPSTMQDVIQAARANPDGVVMFSVRWGGGEHTLLASANPLQGVLFADRTGRLVRSLAELEKFYTGIGSATPYGTMAVVDAARIVRMLNAAGILSSLALEVKSVIVLPTRNTGLPPAKGGASAIRVSPGDSLSTLAKRYYGAEEYWPLLWDANRAVVGPNPNRITPGMSLQVPPFSTFNAAQLADARRRHPTWRSYGR